MNEADTKPTYSLQTRLLYSFSVLLFFFLGLTGFVLDSAFRSSIEAGAVDRLQGRVYLLLAAAEEENGEFYFLEDLQEPRFGQLNSGLYGFISSRDQGVLWRSDSATALQLESFDFLTQEIDVGSTTFNTIEGEVGNAEDMQNFFVLSYGILWEDGESVYEFSVVEDVTPYYSEIADFRGNLWRWLGGVALLLLLIQFILLRWGLSPLKLMEKNLKKIEVGEADKLDGEFPVELAGVKTNLNLLIDAERKQQERYRTTLGDLAHSLKTPLAVITGIVSKRTTQGSPKTSELVGVSEQVQRMDQIVSYQLQRAVQTHNSSALARKVNVAGVVSKLLSALKKVYVNKAMETQVSLDPDAVFFGDERDLMEVLGNLIDNAFKYGRGAVFITVKRAQETGPGIEVIVEDDGKGIPEDQQSFVLERGARVDTLKQGQGIGLAVVMDIVNSYGGDIGFERSKSIGGAKVILKFGEAA
ncbi:MAG: ATP-binding protein [Pseudohongiellaceae bacterium]